MLLVHRSPAPAPHPWHRNRRRCECSAGGAAPDDYRHAIDAAATAELWQAVSAQPASPPPVALARTRLGRGLVATRDLCPGEVVVSVPLEHCLAVDAGPGADARLARLLLDALGGKQSFWRLYNDAVLPRHTGAAALWEPEQAEKLQWPPAVDDALAARLEFRGLAARMGGPHTMEAKLWALSIVHSRSFATPTGLRVLAPLCDLVNNEQLPAATVASDVDDMSPWSVSDGRFELAATTACPAGAELLMFYGHETTSALLISYGFVPGTNPADYLCLYADVEELCDDDSFECCAPDSPGTASRKRAMLWGADAAAAPLAVRPGPLSACAHLLGALRVLHCPAHLLPWLEERHDEHVGHAVWHWRHGAGHAEERQQVDARALQHAVLLARRKLDGMPTTLDADRASLAGTTEPVELVAALRFRLGVKETLARFIATADTVNALE